jgi:hypothetical protein
MESGELISRSLGNASGNNNFPRRKMGLFCLDFLLKRDFKFVDEKLGDSSDPSLSDSSNNNNNSNTGIEDEYRCLQTPLIIPPLINFNYFPPYASRNTSTFSPIVEYTSASSTTVDSAEKKIDLNLSYFANKPLSSPAALILTINPKALARQITLMEFTAYSAISMDELFHQV